MKKFVIVSMIIIMVIPSYAFSEVGVIIDDQQVIFDEVYGSPFIDENNRTQVPLRAVLEAFGAEVNWIAETSTATISLNGRVIEVPIGKDYILVDGTKKMNDTKSLIKDGRTYLPIRIVLESFDANVSWDGKTSSVLVKRPSQATIGTDLNNMAKDFDLMDQFGKSITLESLKGQPILLSFYATW